MACAAQAAFPVFATPASPCSEGKQGVDAGVAANAAALRCGSAFGKRWGDLWFFA